MYAVIGAGPMGLATARNLDKYGIPFVGFDLNADVGGLWDIDNPHSTMYETAHLISSKRMTEFAEFPMKDEVAPYPHHAELREYFRDYAKHFDLYRHYEFNTRVLAVERDGAGWLISTRQGDEVSTRRFDGLLIANGTLHHPNMPTLPGDFAGRLMHASEYRSPSVFDGKRVLVVGCGNSGADIAVDAVHHARKVDLSVRRGYYFLPKFLLGKPTDTLGGKFKLPRRVKQWLDGLMIRAVMGKPSQYGLPDPDYRMYESHPVMNSLILHHLGHGDIQARRDIADIQGHTVTFTDGEQADYDLILMATGYKLHYPFIDREELNWPRDAGAPQLYLNVFHPEHDNLFMMGMIEAAGLGWEGRNEQAELVALYIRQLAAGAPSALKLKEIKRREAGNILDGGYAYLKLDRMAYYVHKDSYRSAVHKHISSLQGDLAPAPTPAAGAA
ncbi:NAD(P)/FAD-dependent oxidoreductase [Alcanivorax sp. JB21]|uniref:flavin-containing monooxygenase n=1 Tax=Alcanivorax limicola TaxID=2874102 RepID=UPI001CBE2E77|nr:NAD(P)/FAD-dependent oxidoreductase [Alcanivorax limicola]MBZ2188729.1 NAD(P)/FAD-dependent oxidoreductase [Alcanivorax limicola]